MTVKVERGNAEELLIILETREEAEVFYNKLNYSPQRHPITISGHLTHERLRRIASDMYEELVKVFRP